MNVLLDTHAFIWFIEGSDRLAPTAREMISSVENGVFLSTVSLWEMAIKASLDKLVLREPLDELITNHVYNNGIGLLSPTVPDILRVEQLPFFHRDPFDRMLAAQAIQSDFAFISADGVFEQYGVSRVWN